MQTIPILPSDPEWNKIDYLIKVGLSSTSVDIQSIDMLHSRATHDSWEKGLANCTILDSFVNTNELSVVNSIHDIQARKGTISLNPPMRFSVGAMRLPADASRKEDEHEVLYCRIAIDHALALETTSQQFLDKLPPGYDCFQILDPPDRSADDVYYHEYVMTNEAKVLPLFVVRFVFDPDGDMWKRNPICKYCNKKPAEVWCIQDAAKLCQGCDASIHDNHPIFGDHKRVPLHEADFMTPCLEHKLPITMFDMVSGQPMCLECPMTGGHAHSPLLHERVIPLRDAFETNATELKAATDAVRHKRATIRQQLATIDRRTSELHRNADEVEQVLLRLVKNLQQRLHTITQDKLDTLRSDTAELERQEGYFAWLDAFLQHQRKVVGPVELVPAMAAHKQLLQAAPDTVVAAAQEVFHDLQLQGDLQLCSVPLTPARSHQQ
eukprot:TRINITY_DN104147_c0_g1_i1.p1 TRINITY_DN104147_c0_g1~~TRINITY_DN104147_c0_g1_i1.p1  ORF type:complete len:437 (-),score=31.07 TRINITY_DN104147_c0_g1_i1:42-1352(-)